MAKLPFNFTQAQEKAALTSLFILLRLVALPCFLETAIPILVLSDGMYNIVIAGENTRFPLLKSF